MLLIISIILAGIACAMLFFSTQVGILAIYISRPFVDTSWEKTIIFGFKLTELVSVLVPLITFLLILSNAGTRRAITKIPYYHFWMFYLAYIFIFSINMAINSSVAEGASLFFRFANGFVGFYLVQSYFFKDKDIKKFFVALALAGLFPIATGLYETITGVHWKITTAEGEIRSIGLYHDAITIRYYGLQTILAIAACFALKFPQKTIYKLGLIGLLFGSLVVVFKALSKSGLLTLAIWAAVWSYGRRSWLIPLIILGASIFVVPIYFQEISDTVYNLFHKEVGAISGKVDVNRTFAGRWGVWAEFGKQWSDLTFIQKAFGSGIPAFGAHNDYLQMAFHGGIVGLILYVSFLIVVAVRLCKIYFKSQEILSVLALMALGMWLVDTIGLVPSLYTGYQWFVWGVIGLCIRRDKDTQDNIRYERKKVIQQARKK